MTLLLPLMLSAGLVSSAKGPCRPNMVRVRVLDVRGNPVAYASVIALQTRMLEISFGQQCRQASPDAALDVRLQKEKDRIETARLIVSR